MFHHSAERRRTSGYYQTVRRVPKRPTFSWTPLHCRTYREEWTDRRGGYRGLAPLRNCDVEIVDLIAI
jgi:hypothetical protein